MSKRAIGEEDTDGWARVTMDEQPVIHVDWTLEGKPAGILQCHLALKAIAVKESRWYV